MAVAVPDLVKWPARPQIAVYKLYSQQNFNFVSDRYNARKSAPTHDGRMLRLLLYLYPYWSNMDP